MGVPGTSFLSLFNNQNAATRSHRVAGQAGKCGHLCAQEEKGERYSAYSSTCREQKASLTEFDSKEVSWNGIGTANASKESSAACVLQKE